MTTDKQQFCRYPDCQCPIEHSADSRLCMQGLEQQTDRACARCLEPLISFNPFPHVCKQPVAEATPVEKEFSRQMQYRTRDQQQIAALESQLAAAQEALKKAEQEAASAKNEGWNEAIEEAANACDAAADSDFCKTPCNPCRSGCGSKQRKLAYAIRALRRDN